MHRSTLITWWNVPCIWLYPQGWLDWFLYFNCTNWKRICTFLWPRRWVFNWLLSFLVCVLRMIVEGRMIWRLHTTLTTVCTASANGRRSSTWKETITRCIMMSPFFSLGRKILPIFSTVEPFWFAEHSSQVTEFLNFFFPFVVVSFMKGFCPSL